MRKTMLGLVKYDEGYGHIELREVPIPEPKDNEIRVKILAAGICGTDVHIMHNEYPHNPPVILGHEWVGYVESCGRNVKNFKQGDKVVSLTAYHICGHCKFCRDGLYMLCDERLSIGSGVNGAMAEYMVFPAERTFKVPDSIKYNEELAICEPLACCARNVIENSPLRAGDVAFISGPGPMGQLTLQCCKAQGAFVIMSGLPKDAERLRIAKELGADVVIENPDEVQDIIHKYAPQGADVVYECAGVAASVTACLHAMKKTGTYSQIGVLAKPTEFDFFEFMCKEGKMMTNAAQMPSSWELILKMLEQERFNLAPLIKKEKLVNWQQAFDGFIAGEGFKTVLIP